MNCGVYQIENVNTGKKYIGSSNQIERRFYLHKWDLRRGKHHSTTLQRAWNKYGENSFIFTVLLYCSEGMRHIYEQLILDALQTYKPENGYNICIDAQAAGKGRVWTAEQRHAKSIERKGKKVSAQTYQNLLSSRKHGADHPMFGKHHTAESLKKISDALTGRKTWNKGKHTGNHQAKITPKQVIEIRNSVYNRKQLSQQYGLNPDTIYKIYLRKLWPNVGGESCLPI